jgi:hypothetical protein
MNVCVRWNLSCLSSTWHSWSILLLESPVYLGWSGWGQHVCTIIWSCFWNGRGLSCPKSVFSLHLSASFAVLNYEML